MNIRMIYSTSTLTDFRHLTFFGEKMIATWNCLQKIMWPITIIIFQSNTSDGSDGTQFDVFLYFFMVISQHMIF